MNGHRNRALSPLHDDLLMSCAGSTVTFSALPLFPSRFLPLMQAMLMRAPFRQACYNSAAVCSFFTGSTRRSDLWRKLRQVPEAVRPSAQVRRLINPRQVSFDFLLSIDVRQFLSNNLSLYLIFLASFVPHCLFQYNFNFAQQFLLFYWKAC